MADEPVENKEEESAAAPESATAESAAEATSKDAAAERGAGGKAGAEAAAAEGGKAGATEPHIQTTMNETAVETPEPAAMATDTGIEVHAPEGSGENVAAMTAMIDPDIGFAREIINGGGADMKKCFQCATCSVVCNVTPEDHPFPRKEMIWAQWGLKDKLMGDPDIWLCHQCNDCTAQCPRDAKPGAVMQSIAKMTLSRLSWPGFLAKGVGSPATLLIMIAIPVIILGLVIAGFGHFSPVRGFVNNGEVQPGGDIIYSNFISGNVIDATFTPAFVFAIIVFLVGISRYWTMMTRSAGTDISGGFGKLGSVLGEIFTHKRFGKCDETEDRKVTHLFIFYAFIGLAITTALAAFADHVVSLPSPYGFTSEVPVKWVGIVSLAAGLIGIGWIIINRVNHSEKIGIGSYFDWQLITLIGVVIVTGGLSWGFRVAEIGVLAYPTYFVHLSSVLFLFLFAPFSKMAHMVYRGTAMVYARTAGRDTPL